MIETTPPAWHYKLEAYICEGGRIEASPFQGWASFDMILRQKPRGCRYAVVEVVDIFDRNTDGRFYVWDFRVPTAHTQQRPNARWVEATASAAVMKAVALYGQD